MSTMGHHTAEPPQRQPQTGRGAETGLYFMSTSGRFVIAVMFLQAINTGASALMILTLLFQQIEDTGPRYFPLDSRIWLPCAAGLLLLAGATVWLAFKITRRSKIARRWALITTGVFIAWDLTVAILALSDTVDYQFGVRGTVGTVVDLVGFALLWSYSVRAWCDR